MNKEIEYTNKNVMSTSRYITLYVEKLQNIIYNPYYYNNNFISRLFIEI